MRVLICGDRNWTDGQAIHKVFVQLIVMCWKQPEDVTVIHGAARGADTIAAHHATLMGCRIEPFPANWNEYGRAAGPIRNKQMLDSGVEVCLGFHDDPTNSRGTKNMIDQAKRAGVKTALYGHCNGEIVLWNSWNW